MISLTNIEMAFFSFLPSTALMMWILLPENTDFLAVIPLMALSGKVTWPFL